MDKIFIKDLHVLGIIGVHEQERLQAQSIIINIVLSTDTLQAAQTDNINNCVNYETVAQKARALTESAGRFTVEALAEDLARLCLDEPGVKSVLVRVEKPGAMSFVGSVGVEIERSKQA